MGLFIKKNKQRTPEEMMHRGKTAGIIIIFMLAICLIPLGKKEKDKTKYSESAIASVMNERTDSLLCRIFGEGATWEPNEMINVIPIHTPEYNDTRAYLMQLNARVEFGHETGLDEEIKSVQEKFAKLEDESTKAFARTIYITAPADTTKYVGVEYYNPDTDDCWIDEIFPYIYAGIKKQTERFAEENNDKMDGDF